MLHPLIATVIQRPDLVVEHVAAYASLINQEAKTAGSQILRHGVSWAVAIICGAVFLSLSGVALMLGFLQGQFHWILLAVPGTALILTIIAVHDARKALPTEHFPELKAQLDSDAMALRMVA